MKKLLLSLFVFATWFSVKSQTNVYHPFPDSNAVWSNYQVNFFCPSPVCTVESCTSNYQYRMKGDTIISGITYHKIYKQGMWSYGQFDSTVLVAGTTYYYTSCAPPVYSSTYFGAIRNDTLNKKVFYLQASLSNETILYDFSLAVGDSLGNIVVTSIDSVLVNGNYRKRFNYNNGLSIIEGIGNVSLGGSQNNVDLFYVNVAEDIILNFICFWQNDAFIYGDSTCSEITSIKEVAKKPTEFLVFPNPSNGMFNLSISKFDNLKTNGIYVYNINGACVHHQIATSANCQIDLSSLNEGVYNISITTNEGVVNKRVVIVH